MRKSRRYLPILLLCGACSFAHAATTTIMQSPHEPDLIGAGGILDAHFGLHNLRSIDNNFDQKWAGLSNVDIAVVAKHSAYTQDIGYMDASNNYVSLMGNITAGSGRSASFNAVNSGSPFPFGLNPSGSPVFSSFMKGNPDNGQDHMVSWLITGGEHAGDFVIAWEDLPHLGDRDYNDLVLRVSGVTPVPIPATAWLFISGLIGVIGIARRKRTRV